MTHQEWRANASLASELKQALEIPAVKAALDILERQTMASTLSGNGLLQLADKAILLFGYDAGRYSVISDLQNLATIPEEMHEIIPSYKGEF